MARGIGRYIESTRRVGEVARRFGDKRDLERHRKEDKQEKQQAEEELEARRLQEKEEAEKSRSRIADAYAAQNPEDKFGVDYLRETGDIGGLGAYNKRRKPRTPSDHEQKFRALDKITRTANRNIGAVFNSIFDAKPEGERIAAQDKFAALVDATQKSLGDAKDEFAGYGRAFEAQALIDAHTSKWSAHNMTL